MAHDFFVHRMLSRSDLVAVDACWVQRNGLGLMAFLYAGVLPATKRKAAAVLWMSSSRQDWKLSMLPC